MKTQSMVFYLKWFFFLVKTKRPHNSVWQLMAIIIFTLLVLQITLMAYWVTNTINKNNFLSIIPTERYPSTKKDLVMEGMELLFSVSQRSCCIKKWTHLCVWMGKEIFPFICYNNYVTCHYFQNRNTISRGSL